MKTFVVFFILCYSLFCYSQCASGELLRNPSFETNTTCGAAFNFAFQAPGTPIPNVTDWYGVNDWSPDYYACGGTQFSLTGIMGMILRYPIQMATVISEC